MLPTRHHRRLGAILALVAMLAFALVPAMSRALATTAQGAALAAVCTPQGVQWRATDPRDAPRPPAGGAGHLDACPLCQLATDGAAPLQAAAVDALPPPASAGRPWPSVPAAPAPAAWCLAQPRAPPATT